MEVDIFTTTKKYNVIYADPPWEYKESGGGHRGTAGLPYSTMTTKQIGELPIQNIVDERSILFIWATFKKLKECLKVIEMWGYEYYGLGFDWTKTEKTGTRCFGMGFYTRQNNEICLIGVPHDKKRRLMPINRSVSCVIQSERREHSRKPDEVRKCIELIFGNVDRIELFARQQKDGWDCWGDEIRK